MSERSSLVVESFRARRRWQRSALRWWRVGVYCRIPGKNRRGLSRKGYRYIVPPAEWPQEQADEMISLGREMAEKHGW